MVVKMSIEDVNSKIKLHLKTANIKLSHGEYDLAIEELKAAEMLDTENPEVLFNLGVAHAKDGLHSAAAGYYEKILKSKTGSVDSMKVRKLYAYSNIILEKFNEALKTIDECLKLVLRDVELLNMAGYCYEKMKKYKNAVDSYSKVIEIQPENTNACNSIAYILAETNGDLNKALSFAKKALNSDPENPAYLDTIGFVHMKRDEKTMAKKYIKKAYEKMPLSQEVKLHLNQLLGI